MTHRRTRGKPRSASSSQGRPSARRDAASTSGSRDRFRPHWADRESAHHSSALSSLTQLIERDVPLQSNTALVLMYGPFQAEMSGSSQQGVASWLRDCIRQHGMPSLVRFDYRHRAQVLRRDQFQPWLDSLTIEAKSA